MISRSRFRAIVLIALAAEGPAASQAEEANPPPDQEQWNLHFQATSISQGHGEFSSPYSGTNSLPPREPIRTSYTATLDTPAYGLDIARSRRYSDKYGFGLNLEQALSKNLGAFARLGWSDGQNETWAFTEIDQTASLGLSLRGAAWSQPADAFGVAGVINGLAKEHKDYLAAGGYGFIIGDGRLNYAPEEIIEVYYLLNVWKGISITPDYQFVNHPAYNADRGPVHLWAIRFHAEF